MVSGCLMGSTFHWLIACMTMIALNGEGSAAVAGKIISAGINGNIMYARRRSIKGAKARKQKGDS